jgi:hypothetical protein
MHKFLQSPSLVTAQPRGNPAGVDEMPQVRLADGVDSAAMIWPDLGYAGVYLESYGTFAGLRDQGLVADGVRFQAQ